VLVGVCRFVSVEDVPEDILAKEREIEAGKDDLASKPEAIRWAPTPAAESGRPGHPVVHAPDAPSVCVQVANRGMWRDEELGSLC
jgi:hypothetical protein